MSFKIINGPFNWSKYKGEPLKEVIEKDLDYFIWCIKQGYTIDGSVLDYIDSKIRIFNTLRESVLESLKNPKPYVKPIKEEIKQEPNKEPIEFKQGSVSYQSISTPRESRDLSKDYYAPRYDDDDWNF